MSKKEETTTNSGSADFQATELTAKIKHLTEHLKISKKDHMARRGLLQAVGQRKRHLKYIAKKSPDDYLSLIKKLGLRK
jgi:small subunit ribosomal protein S15